jgi:hypothetical protein
MAHEAFAAQIMDTRATDPLHVRLTFHRERASPLNVKTYCLLDAATNKMMRYLQTFWRIFLLTPH